MVIFDPYMTTTRHDLRGRSATLAESPSAVVRTMNDRWVGATPVSLAPQWYRELVGIAALKENWDGYGSPRVNPTALEVARQLLSEAQQYGLSSPHIAPVTGGGVNIEWVVDERELEVEVLPTGAVEYLMSVGDDSWEGQLDLNRQGLEGLVSWVLTGQELAATA